MGLFGKIKNILFEDEEEVEETMPVFTKDEVKPVKKEEVVDTEKEEPIKVVPGSRFKNVKRDIDLSFDEKDVLDEVVSSYSNSAPVENKEHIPEKKEEEVVKKAEPENKSPFLSFDEDEFERLNSRINRNEEKVRRKEKEEKKEKLNYQETARRANNNYSSTTPNRNVFEHSLNNNTVMNNGRKPFTPSPVISPVYGILDKNYKKGDIVDRDNPDDIVRVKVDKTRVSKPEAIDELIYHEEKHTTYEAPKYVSHENNVTAKHQEIDLDYVRKKAYGTKDYLNDEDEQNLDIKSVEKKETKVDQELDDIDHIVTSSKRSEPRIEETMDLFKDESPVKDVKIDQNNKLDDNVNDIIKLHEDDEELITPTTSETTDSSRDKDISDLILDDMEKNEDVVVHRGRALEDLEKTSTLQILDDIEKELNSIKPISKNEEKNEENDDTLEDDLFNLIDSMYEGGDEEDD